MTLLSSYLYFFIWTSVSTLTLLSSSMRLAVESSNIWVCFFLDFPAFSGLLIRVIAMMHKNAQMRKRDRNIKGTCFLIGSSGLIITKPTNVHINWPAPIPLKTIPVTNPRFSAGKYSQEHYKGGKYIMPHPIPIKHP